MKLKCPNCQSLLQVPATAAGRVVACRCGKRLRAPAGPSAPAPTAASGSPPTRGPGGRATAGTAAARGRTAAPDIDAGLFDELTEADLKPVGAVSRPGSTAAPAKSTGDKLLHQYGVTGSTDASPPVAGARPGLLTFIGVINAFWAVLMLLATLAIFGLVAAAPLVAPKEARGEGANLLILAGGLVMFVFVVNLATAISCFVAAPACWSIVLFSYAFNVADRVMGIVGDWNAGAETSDLVKGGVGMIVGILFFAYLHRQEVRRFYRIRASRLKMAVIPDVLGLVIGLSLGYVAAFMM